jgi:hypothetical protein
MVCKASSLLKERTKAFLFDVERLRRLEHARNGELKSNSYTKKVPLVKRSMVSFFESLEVHIPLFGVNNIRKINVQPTMSNNNAKIVNLLAPQPMAYDFEFNRPSLVTFRNGGSPNVNNKTTMAMLKLLEEEKRTLEACSAFFGDGGPLVGNNNNKHFTKRD